MGSGLVNVSKPKIVGPNTFPKGRRNTTGMNSKIEEMFVFAHIGKQYSQRENMQHLEDHNAYLTEEKKGKGRGQGLMVRGRGRRRGNLQSSPKNISPSNISSSLSLMGPSRKMIILSWNVRGLEKPHNFRALQRLNAYSPNIIFLMETKRRRRKMTMTRLCNTFRL